MTQAAPAQDDAGNRIEDFDKLVEANTAAMKAVLEEAGLTSAAIEEAVARVGVKVAHPDDMPDQAKSAAGLYTKSDLRRARLLEEGVRQKIDATAQANTATMSREEYAQELKAAVSEGAFDEMSMRVAERTGMKPDEVATQVMLSDGSSALYTVQYFDDFIRPMLYQSPFRSRCTTIPMPETPGGDFPTVTNEPNPDIHVDGAGITPQDFTFANVRMDLSELAVSTKFSNKTLRRGRGAILPLIANSFAEQAHIKAHDQYSDGTGTSQPRGLTNFTIASGKTVAVNGELAYEHTTEAFRRLGQQYLRSRTMNGLAWVCNPYGYEAFELVRDKRGLPLWGDVKSENDEVMFMARNLPVIILEGIAGEATEESPTDIYLAGLKRAVYIGDGQDSEFFVSEHRHADEAATLFRYTVSHDMRQADTSAIVKLTDVVAPRSV